MKLFIWTFLGIIAFVLSAPTHKGCRMWRCKMYCPAGFKLDVNGCAICRCKPPVIQPGIAKPIDESKVSVAVTVSVAEATATCPSAHPYAYYNGDFCCKYGREKIYAPQGASCDGGTLEFSSKCCKDDDYARCVSPPCTNNAPGCGKWRCKMACPAGFKLDVNGCEICKCKPPVMQPADEEASRDDSKLLAETESPMANYSEQTESENNDDNENEVKSPEDVEFQEGQSAKLDVTEDADDVTEPLNNAESSEDAGEPGDDAESIQDNIIEFRNAFVDSSAAIYPEASKDVATLLEDTAVYCNGC